MTSPTRWRRVGHYLGLLRLDDGPAPVGRGTSRYDLAPGLSPRLDQDVDELRARVRELERRLGA